MAERKKVKMVGPQKVKMAGRKKVKTAGRRKGETRRLNHDIFAGIREWNQLDQARIRELYESHLLRKSALAFIDHIRELAPNIEAGALEALAHGLVREELKTPSNRSIIELPRKPTS
jgi:hypothetical protein